MTTNPPRATHRPVRVLADIILRAGGLVAATAGLASLSDQSDALAAGLTAFVVLVSLAFAVSMLDGLFQRDRPRLYLVWAVVVPLVGLLETALYLHMVLTGPGAYASLRSIAPGDIGETFLVYTAILVGAPAALGLLLGVLSRPNVPAPAAPVRP